MSIYPKFQGSNTFNTSDIISYEDSNKQMISLDLSGFVNANNPVLTSDLYLKGETAINFGGKVQNQAYDNTEKAKNDLNESKLTNVSYDEDNNETIINNKLDLTNSTLNFNDDQIPQSKITNLVSRLQGIDNNLANISNNDTDILNIQNDITNNIKPDIIQNTTDITNNKNDYDIYIAQNNTDKINMDLNILSNETKNTEQDGRLTINEAKNTEQDGRLDLIETKNTEQDNRLTVNETKNTEQDNRLTVNETKNTEQDGRLDLIETKDLEQDGRLTVNEAKNTEQDNRLTVNETKNTEQDGRLTVNEAKNTEQDGRLDLIETKNTEQDTSISNLNALTTSHTNNISLLQTEDTTQNSRLDTLETDILTKHSTINNSNKLNVSYIGNGDVDNNKLSSLNDIRTDVSVQYQLTEMKTELDLFDGSNVVNNTNRIITLENQMLTKEDIISDSNKIDISNVNNLQTELNNIDTKTINNLNSINTINTNLTTLTNADGLHDSQITNLQNQDTTLQNNINLKHDIIDVNNKLDSGLINDTNLNDTLDNVLNSFDTSISALENDKQDVIDVNNKLNSSLINRNDNLIYFDINSSLNGKLSNIDANITLLQGTDTTIITDIQDNFDTHDASITALQNSVSTLQGLQDGDIVSFQNINNSITNLTNTKHPLIDSDNKLNSSLLNRNDNLQHIDISSSLQTTLDNLQSTKQDLLNNTTNKLNHDKVDFTTSNIRFADYPSSINDKMTSLDSQISTLNSTDVAQGTTNTNLQNQINSNVSDITDLQNQDTTLQNNINLKHDIIDVNNKLDSSLLNRNDNLQHIDISSSLQTKLNSLDTDIATKHDIIDVNNKLDTDLLNRNDNLQYIDISSSLQTKLNSLDTDISTKHDIIDVNNKLDTDLLNRNDNLQHIDISSSLQTKLNSLDTDIATVQTNIDNKKCKIEEIDDNLQYNTSTNVLTHTYNEENIFVNSLDDNGLLELQLTINSPSNYKTYNQRVFIDCLQYKGYINVLKINGNTVEIKHRDGDSNINLAPISGYSMIEQTLILTYMSDTWYAMSNIELFYNSNSNSVYDVTAPVITMVEVNGNTVINHEINTAYNDAGATANDNIDGDVTNNIVVTGSVNTAVLGVYNITYTVQDSKGNESQAVRVVNVIDTTNPVVTLTGPSTVNLNTGDTYTEQGATATDNSGESLTVTIGGDVVDTANAGSYTVTYTATDSSSNSHQIGRLVVVSDPVPTLQYSNPSTDIFQYLNFDSNSDSDYDTQSLWTLTGQTPSWKNGDYEVRATSLRSDNTIKHFHSIFSGTPYSTNGKFFESRLGSHPVDHHQYGTSYGVGSAWVSVGDGKYDFQHYNLDTATLPASYFETNLDNASTLTGEYIYVKFPFFLKVSSFEITNNISPSSTAPVTIYLVASNDDITYTDLTGPVDFQGLSALTTNISTGNATGYKHLRLICTQAPSRTSFMFELFKIYGDVYDY